MQNENPWVILHRIEGEHFSDTTSIMNVPSGFIVKHCIYSHGHVTESMVFVPSQYRINPQTHVLGV